MKSYRNKSLTMKVMLGLVVAVCFLPPQAAAQNDINSFNTCVQGVAAAGLTIAQVASTCVPAGCFYTNTMSEESGQPACTLRGGTRLPRVIFSCPGPGGSQTLRFRPSFSLCTLGTDGVPSIIDHIEQGEDVAQRIDHQTIMKMGDITFKTPTADVRVDVTAKTRVCTDCHDLLGAAGGFRLYGQIPTLVSEGTLSTNDPKVAAPGVQVPLSTICADINFKIGSATGKTKAQLVRAYGLCVALLGKE